VANDHPLYPLGRCLFGLFFGIFLGTRHLFLQRAQCFDIAQCRLFSLLVDALNSLAL